MIKLYEEKDYESAYRLKKKLFTIYLAILIVTLVLCGVFLTLFLFLPYPSTQELTLKKNLYLTADCALSVAFVIFSVIYLSIPYKRAKFYFKMLDDIKTGDKQFNESTFLQNETNITEVRYVDFRVMAVLEWSPKKQDYLRRNVLVDKEKPMPDLKSGDMIVYTTHANVLLSYGLKGEETVFDDFEKEKK